MPYLEQRRHLPTANLTELAGRWMMGKKAPSLNDWLPEYAQTGGGVPKWVKLDMKVGVDLRLASQELYDALQDLERM